MATDPRLNKALNFMRALGVSGMDVKPVLKKLLGIYGGKWELIEDDNYQALVDAYFDPENDKEPLLVDEDDQDLSIPGSSSQMSSAKDKKMSPKTSSKKIIEPSQTFMEDIKPKICKHSSHTMLSEVEKASSAGHRGHFEKEFVKPSTKKPKIERTSTNPNGLSDASFGNLCNKTLSTQDQDVQGKDVASECNCLSSSLPCGCAQETGGEYAYNLQGLLKEEFLTACVSMKNEPKPEHYVYCQECPLEKSKNEYKPERCKGHTVRKFIKECWRKCGCDMHCGNRIVQRGIACKLQVFLTREGKGWGLRTLEDLPKGSFVCEYVGEILTNTELYDRIMLKNSGEDRHTYPVTLDADWGSERVLKDEEALCLDATYNGNVGRFINHRCSDANLIDIPVEIESPDHHYYHLAFFTNKDVSAYEELTWDYGIDFNDHNHPIKAFRCCCGSRFCTNKKQKGKGKIKIQDQGT